jgi:hypothetical protein
VLERVRGPGQQSVPGPRGMADPLSGSTSWPTTSVGDSKRRSINADRDAVVLQAVEQCVDQGLALEQLVPVRVVEVRCKALRENLWVGSTF